MGTRIAGIRDPNQFQRLVHALFAAERGRDFQTVDDSAGDRGNDGYDPQSGWLFAIYCPEKGLQRDRLLEKARADLAKAVRLKSERGYRIVEWVFVTPEALPERVQATLRAEASDAGLRATFLSATHLESTYLQYPHLHDLFPELEYPRIEAKLEALNAKLDDLAAGRGSERESDATDPVSQAQITEPEEYSVELFPGFRSDGLATLQARLHAGDQKARYEVEQYRLEATDVRDRLAAMMVEIEYEAERLNFDATEHLSADACKLAEKIGAKAEAGVFRARLAYSKTMKLVPRETEFLSGLGMSATVGLPLVSEAEASWFDREVPRLRTEINKLFKSAYQDARESRNLLALMSVVLLYANATTHSTFPLRVPGRELLTLDSSKRIAYARGIVEGAYDLAISLAQALGSKRLLAAAYSNFANDLSVFDDRERAMSHALRALDLAREVGDKNQSEKTEQLIDALRAKRTEE